MIHNHCVACGQSGNLNQHHLVPRSIGGNDDETNLITLCGSCHAKAHQVKADWRHGELTKKALGAKKARGEYIGGYAPYGFYIVDGKLVSNELEQKAIIFANHLSMSGLSLNKVAKELAKIGMLARNGKVFDAQQIKRMKETTND